MKDWRNFFLQRMGTDENGSAYPVCESVKTWGVWCSEIPFVLVEKAKEPAKRTWNDEHGDDEFISDDGLFMEAYEMQVKFGCKKMTSTIDGSETISAIDDVRVKVGDFIEYLRTSGMMNMYSSHTRIGRQNVRFVSVDDKAEWDTSDEQEFLVFEAKFKVNDPVTDITLS